jgi:circadian clock protein KaiC
VLPLTSLELRHTASDARVPTGVPALDEMFGGPGYFRGSSILVSGAAGTGKTSLGAQFVDAACVFWTTDRGIPQEAPYIRQVGR